MRVKCYRYLNRFNKNRPSFLLITNVEPVSSKVQSSKTVTSENPQAATKTGPRWTSSTRQNISSETTPAFLRTKEL